MENVFCKNNVENSTDIVSAVNFHFGSDFKEIEQAIDLIPKYCPINNDELKCLIINSTSFIIENKLNEFDLAVLDAVLSLLTAGYSLMSEQMIFFTMANRYFSNDLGETIIYQETHILDKIDKILFKLLGTFCVFYIEKNNRITRKVGRLLNFETLSIISGTNIKSCYEFSSNMTLYQSAAEASAISFVPIVKCSLNYNMSQRSIALISFLQHKVSGNVWDGYGQCRIDYDALQNRSFTRPAPPSITIKCKDIYKKMMDIVDDAPQEYASSTLDSKYIMMKWIRNFICDVLVQWKNNSIIYDWSVENDEVNTDGNDLSFTSFTIHFYPVF